MASLNDFFFGRRLRKCRRYWVADMRSDPTVRCIGKNIISVCVYPTVFGSENNVQVLDIRPTFL